MAAKASDKVYGRQWCFLAVPWKLPATVKWQCRLAGFSISEERQRRRHGCILWNIIWAYLSS